jgi:hypothetical protein
LAYLFLSSFLSPLSSANAQNQSQPEASNANTQPSQVIRSATRLVQANVVVQNKEGIPITGLKAADFSLLDNGRPQEIAFFFRKCSCFGSCSSPATAHLPIAPT